MKLITIGTAAGKPVKLDLARLIETRLLLTSSSGGGKSTTARTLVEGAYGQVQVIIIDPEGEFTTLRPAFDFVILGKGGDVELNPRHAATYAHTFLKLGKDLVVDLSEFDLHQRQAFVRDFLTAMVDAPRELWHQVLVILDEAHEFAPEKSPAVSSTAVISMASKGRKRGFCLVPASQRLAKLSKDVAAENQNKLVGLANLPDDRKRGAEELGFTGKAEVLQLRDLEKGEFFAVGPAFVDGAGARIRDVVRITVALPKTKPPVRGTTHRAPAASAKLQAELKKLKDLPAAAEQEVKDLAAAKAEITQLKRQLGAAARPAAPVAVSINTQEIKKQVGIAIAQMGKQHLAELKALSLQLLAVYKNVDKMIQVAGRATAGPGLLKMGKSLIQFHTETGVDQGPMVKTSFHQVAMRSDQVAPLKSFPAPPATERTSGHRLAERQLVTFLNQEPGTWYSKVRAAVATGYALTGGGFQNAMGALARHGLIERQGDQVRLVPGADVQHLLTGETFTIEAWMGKLKRAMERKILRHLIDHPGETFTREALAEAVDAAVGGGGFQNALGKLNTLALIKRSGNAISLNPEAQ